MLYHLLALLTGTILDLIIGDPHGIWHPVVTIGRWIGWLDKRLLGEGESNLLQVTQKKRGRLLVLLVILPVVILTAIISLGAYAINPICGFVVEAVLSCYCLALKSLIKESGEVVRAYEAEGIEKARYALSMIVGRDTKNLELDEILRATVETVAENASDGVVAPFLYLLIGGPILGLAYKAVNTMDSMVGYHNDRYEYFGSTAARLDDYVNRIPSRLTAMLTILVAAICGNKYDAKCAYRIFKRDRFNHKSPNSAQSEAAFAGALSLRLGGPSFYFGKLVDKPTIGDPIKTIDKTDVSRAHGLLLGIGITGQVLLIIFIVIYVIGALI